MFDFLTQAKAERIFFAGYKGGFYIRSEEEGGMELRFGGTFQTDYRYYFETQRADNHFDVRRARLIFNGQLTQYFRYGMEFEFQGNETDNLIDAWGEAGTGLNWLKFGQFKEPFSLEWQTRDKALYFAERSIGYSLSPKRDVGLMLHGTMLKDSLDYAIGAFNGDGDDGDSRGNQHDDPEIAGRIVIAPFASSDISFLKFLQVGASATFAKIDQINVNLAVKSTGMYGSTRKLYELTHNTKFGVLQDVDSRIRLGAELGWSVGSLAIMGEYVQFKYTDLKPAGKEAMDADFSSEYISCLYFLTGEEFVFSQGVLKPVYPKRFFDPSNRTWGAIGLGIRLEEFKGDSDWIVPDANVSVESAKAVTVSANWILFPMLRVVLDYTLTDFSDPIRVRVLENGQVDFIEKENVLTMRFGMDF